MDFTRVQRNLISTTPGFDEKTLKHLDVLVKSAERRTLRRGEVLVRYGEPSETFYFVLSGRFSVHTPGTPEPIAEISQGQPIGEVGFFGGLARTATVKAVRDSSVLVITRERFRELSKTSHEIQDAVIVSLARRLSDVVRPDAKTPTPTPTVALLWAGAAKPSDKFVELLESVFGKEKRIKFLTRDDIVGRFSECQLDSATTTDWLNSLETEFDFIFYIADPDLTDWTKKCIRQTDTILLVAAAGASTELNSSERFAFSIHPPSARRLVLVHEARRQIASGTSSWLKERDVLMHHHVALADTADVRRLYRFMSGQALGFVAGGGGARGSVHLGAYKAFREAGAEFDILGGTSSGAAMTAALAYGVEPERVDAGTHNIFVTHRAFRRLTFPRYGLINHKVFDAALKEEYGEVLIEDLWVPFFAVSSSLSDHTPRVHRTGLVWHAVRASGSIPAILPPFFTTKGEMLVDGALVANIPLEQMRALKAGPNVVVAPGVGPPKSYAVDYDGIPGPAELIVAMLNPFRRLRLPAVPSILQVVMLSMLADHHREPPTNEMDILIKPELPEDIRYGNWDRHTEIFTKSYQDVAAWIRTRIAENDAKVLAVIAKRDGPAHSI